MADLGNVELGACAVSVDGTDVGHTSGPVVLRIEPIWRPVREEAHGETPVDHVYLGSAVTVTATFDEKTLANLKRALPYALDGGTYLGEGRAPGLRMGALATQVTLHPLEAADASRDIVLHRAVARGPFALAFEEGRERSFEVVFVGLADPTKPDGERIARLYQS